jgi:hypothetical protein
MKNDDLRLDTKVENRDYRLKRASSLFMSSNSLEIEDSIAESAEQNEVSDMGNQAPKRRHKSLPLSFIATNEEGKEMPSIELTPSASVNLGANFDYEADIANNLITSDFLKVNLNSPTRPGAPIRQASKSSLMDGIDDVGISGAKINSSRVALYFDQEQEDSANFSNGEVKKEETSPSLSPRAKNSPIETFKVESKMRE